jgi:hypothetical protein
MIFAFDLPITPVRAMALRQVRPADKQSVSYSPLAAERVWAWDPKKEVLKVFLKPDSFASRDHKNFKDDYGNRPAAEQWEIVARGDMKPKYIRKFVDDPSLFNELGWVKLTDK